MYFSILYEKKKERHRLSSSFLFAVFQVLAILVEDMDNRSRECEADLLTKTKLLAAKFQSRHNDNAVFS